MKTMNDGLNKNVVFFSRPDFPEHITYSRVCIQTIVVGCKFCWGRICIIFHMAVHYGTLNKDLLQLLAKNLASEYDIEGGP
jgi:hypothetical protein